MTAIDTTLPTAFTWKEVDEERYWEMLEILPPIDWEMSRGFMVGEAWDHKRCSVTGAIDATAFGAFARKDGKYYECLQPMTRAEWRAFDRKAMVMAVPA